MKWIGQHIWDFISRFRSKVYLEDVANAGSDTDAFLVKKADGEVAIRTGAEVLSDIGASSESNDLEFSGNTANGVLTYGGAAQIDVESTLTWDGIDLTATSATSASPELILENTTSDNKPSYLRFYKNRVGTNSDVVGSITFDGKDAGGSEQIYGTILTQIVDATASDESAMMELKVATSDGSASSRRNVIKGTGSASDNDVDAEIGYGVTSVTTIAGDLDIDGDNMTSAGAMTFTPAGLYTIVAPDISGPVFVIDADADTDNEVEINAGTLDINVASSATISVATSITISGITRMPNRTLTVTSGSAAGEIDGDVVYTGTTTGMTTGALYVYVGTGQWVLANAGAIGTTKGLLAIALGDESDVDGMLLRGMVTTTTVSGTQDEGAELYMRDVNGVITTIAPTSSGDFVRIVGYCMENSNNRIYFNPDNTYIEIA